jgi:hypothetical protein
MSPFLFTGEVAIHQQGFTEKDRICEDPCSLQEKAGKSASYVHGLTFGVSVFAAAEEVSVSLIHSMQDDNDEDDPTAEESDKSKSEINDDEDDEDVCTCFLLHFLCFTMFWLLTIGIWLMSSRCLLYH